MHWCVCIRRNVAACAIALNLHNIRSTSFIPQLTISLTTECSHMHNIPSPPETTDIPCAGLSSWIQQALPGAVPGSKAFQLPHSAWWW